LVKRGKKFLHISACSRWLANRCAESYGRFALGVASAADEYARDECGSNGPNSNFVE